MDIGDRRFTAEKTDKLGNVTKPKRLSCMTCYLSNEDVNIFQCDACSARFCMAHLRRHPYCRQQSDDSITLCKCGNKTHPYYDEDVGYDVCYRCDGKVKY